MADYDEVPAWDILDRHVLRFYGFGKESVVETNLENYRNRQYKILFYLQDDTVLRKLGEVGICFFSIDNVDLSLRSTFFWKFHFS